MPLLPPIAPKKLNQARVDWRLAEFRKAVWVYGQTVKWELAARCPCRQYIRNDETRLDENLGHARADCPECRGTGTLYHSPQQTVALVEDMARNPEAYKVWGQSVFGGARFTMLPENRPHFLDRITLLHSVMPYHEVRVRRTTTEQPRYPIVVRNIAIATDGDNTESRELQVGVIYIRKVDGSGRVDGVELVEGTDFTVDGTAGTVTWIDGAGSNAPAQGTGYTISYYAHPVYVVHGMGYAARDTFVKFKQASPTFRENVTAVTDAWLEILGVPGWPSDGVG